MANCLEFKKEDKLIKEERRNGWRWLRWLIAQKFKQIQTNERRTDSWVEMIEQSNYPEISKEDKPIKWRSEWVQMIKLADCTTI